MHHKLNKQKMKNKNEKIHLFWVKNNKNPPKNNFLIPIFRVNIGKTERLP